MCLGVEEGGCELVELCGTREEGGEHEMLRKGQSSSQVREKGPCRTVEPPQLHFPTSLPNPSESRGMDQILLSKI